MPNGSRRHYRLTLGDALDAHEQALRFGGLPSIINLGSIESAITRPYSGYYRTIPRKAAALVESMVGNHGFADGNKRTTLILLNLLERSGYRLTPSERRGSIEREVEARHWREAPPPVRTGSWLLRHDLSSLRRCPAAAE